MVRHQIRTPGEIACFITVEVIVPKNPINKRAETFRGGRTVRWFIFSVACMPLLSGCVMVDVGVSNPVVGLTTVAIAPFFNLSQERAVDGRRFAFAYYTELQKTPGFQVIPVGVVEQAMFDHQLEMNNPTDVLKLAQLLNADAVVVGAVTDYSPYYPPRVGMQVSWYSPKPWTFYPGPPTDEYAREMVLPHRFSILKHHSQSEMVCPPETCPPEMITTPGMVPPTTEPVVISPRGQSPDETLQDMLLDDGAAKREPKTRSVSLPEFLTFGTEGDPSKAPVETRMVSNIPSEFDLHVPNASSTATFDPRQPLMSYTRMFDGTDAKLTARLRDYVELRGDLRAGGWTSYLYRSEDFIRFTAHVMIVEMLQMHGGEARKRIVFKFRKYR